jgi:hypothetical protein
VAFALIRQRIEAAGLPFHVGVEALSADLRMSLVARSHDLGIVMLAAFRNSSWREAVEVIDCLDAASATSWAAKPTNCDVPGHTLGGAGSAGAVARLRPVKVLRSAAAVLVAATA